MCTETELCVAEMVEPSIQGMDSWRAAMKSWTREAGNGAEQVARLVRLLQEAELAEQRPEVKALFEEGFQILGALRRTVGEIERHSRTLARAMDQFDDWRGRLAAAHAASPDHGVGIETSPQS